ncbi:MAG TPA: hypothetical protein VHI71_06500 [Actinomycetota bacterium]|nr:hypothetical protein [Actinomycetota bacterium]
MSEEAERLELTITLNGASFSGAGSADRVTAALERFAELVAEHRATPPSPPEAEERPEKETAADGKSAGGTSGTSGSGTKVPFGVFMKRKFPNQHATATAIFTWAKRHDGKDSMKPGEMQTYWKKVLKKAGNPTQVCQNAEKQGWLENVGGGAYAVTGHGEQMVDKLPAADDE